MKIFIDSDKRWTVRQVKEKPRLCAPKLATETENHWQNNVNPESMYLEKEPKRI